MTTIGRYTFSRCTSLESITIPDGVTTIEDRAFTGCNALKEVTLENIHGWSFYDDSGKLVDTVPDIEPHLFSNPRNVAIELTLLRVEYHWKRASDEN